MASKQQLDSHRRHVAKLAVLAADLQGQLTGCASSIIHWRDDVDSHAAKDNINRSASALRVTAQVLRDLVDALNQEAGLTTTTTTNTNDNV